VGFNNIDISYAREKGIMVTNTPGVLTDATADLTWALILAVARCIPQAEVFTRAKKYKGWALDLFLGKELTGKRLGIIGMGRIGKAVALKAHAFNMEVVYSDPHRLSLKEENRYRATRLALDELLRTSDIVSLHTTLTPDTFHLMSKENIKKMKSSAILINVSRGPVVDESALADALQKRKIWGAGLDVYENEPAIHPKLFEQDNVVLLPHIGSATRETRLKMAKTAAMNLVQGLQGKRPDNLVV
jgi:glyoxylate reductase